MRVWWVVGTLKTVRGHINDVQGSYTILARFPDGVLPHTMSASPLGVVSARSGARSKVEAGIVSEDDEFWAVDRFRISDALLSLDVFSIVVVDASTSFFGFRWTWPKVRGEVRRCGDDECITGHVPYLRQLLLHQYQIYATGGSSYSGSK